MNLSSHLKYDYIVKLILNLKNRHARMWHVYTAREPEMHSLGTSVGDVTLRLNVANMNINDSVKAHLQGRLIG